MPEHPRPNLAVSIPMACRAGLLDPHTENMVCPDPNHSTASMACPDEGGAAAHPPSESLCRALARAHKPWYGATRSIPRPSCVSLGLSTYLCLPRRAPPRPACPRTLSAGGVSPIYPQLSTLFIVLLRKEKTTRDSARAAPPGPVPRVSASLAIKAPRSPVRSRLTPPWRIQGRSARAAARSRHRLTPPKPPHDRPRVYIHTTH